jgi:outer membrane protein
MKRVALAILVPLALASQPAQPPPSQPMRLTLADAQRIAVENNPRYSSAKFTAAAAHQQPAEYRAAELPTLSGQITGVGADNGTRLAAGALNNPTVYSRAATGVIANQLITDFGRTHNLVGMSNLQAQAQDQNGEATRADVVLGATRAYYDLLRAQAVLKVAGQTVTARQLVSEQTGALAQSKLRSQLDVTFADVNLSDARLLQLQAENGVNSAEAELAAALGLPAQTSFDVADEPMPAALPTQPDPLIAQAMQTRPDLKTLQLQQSAAERFTRAEHDLYYPTVSALAAAGAVPAGVSQVPREYGAVGLNVSIPILNGGLFKARESEASLRAQAAAKNVADLANRITRDVRVAWLNSSTALRRVSLTQQLVDQATQALDLAQSRYSLGLSSIVELSQAQLNLTAAQIQSATARYDYQAQRGILDYQTGALR